MSKISWGKCSIYIKDLETTGAKWKKIPTPIEDSTELTTEKGDKLEAKIEGGENEDVKYKRNTYTLAYGIRRMKNRVMPFADVDGVIDHQYAVAVVPEDPNAPACLIDKTYTHDVLKPDSGNAVKWGTITVGEADADGNIESITCAAITAA